MPCEPRGGSPFPRLASPADYNPTSEVLRFAYIRPALDLPTADPYDTLGVPSGASAEDIKRAFRRKASFYHPDRNAAPDAAQRFREAQAAYELLSDDTRRRAHDEKRQKHLLDDPVAVARRMFESYLEDIE